MLNKHRSLIRFCLAIYAFSLFGPLTACTLSKLHFKGELDAEQAPASEKEEGKDLVEG